MVISHSHRFIYFAPQKTGSTSIRQMLVEQFGAEVLGGIHGIYLPEEYDDYFTFCTVRNPYARALSAYNFLREWEIEEAIDDCCTIGDWHWARPIYTALFGRDLVEGAVPTRLDVFLKLESIGEEFNRLPFVKAPVSVPMVNVSEKFRVAYGIQVFHFVREFYAKDFTHFGYSDDWCDLGLKIHV